MASGALADGAAGAGPGATPTGVGSSCFGTGVVLQAARLPTIKAHNTLRKRPLFMGVIFLEALGAMLLLVLIVWWTMFSGRKGGEIAKPHTADAAPEGDPKDKP
jgi:hypothetical protein